MIADCSDCGRVELYRGLCPFCNSQCVAVGGMWPKLAKKLTWLQKIKVAKRNLAQRVLPFVRRVG